MKCEAYDWGTFGTFDKILVFQMYKNNQEICIVMFSYKICICEILFLDNKIGPVRAYFMKNEEETP